MVITKINHGLGNQLFQYATGRNLARQLDTPLILDTSAYSSSSFRQYQLNHFGISQPILNPLARFAIRKLRQRTLTPVRLLAQNCGIIRLVKDKERGFDETLPDQGENLHLEGFWQSERYFADMRETLLTELTLPAPIRPGLFIHLPGPPPPPPAFDPFPPPHHSAHCDHDNDYWE